MAILTLPSLNHQVSESQLPSLILPWVRTVKFDITDVVVLEKGAFKANLVVSGSFSLSDLASCTFLEMHKAGAVQGNYSFALPLHRDTHQT